MNWLRNLARPLLAWGPWGILLLAVLDSAGIPIPEGVDVMVVLVAVADARAGYLSAALATLGSAAGCLFLFYLGRKGGEAYLEKRTRTGWGRKMRRWFDRYGLVGVFIVTLVPAPLPTKAFILAAGALGSPALPFLLVILAARLPRYFGEAYLGAQVGVHSLDYFHQHSLALLAAAAALFLFLYLLVKLKDRLGRRSAEAKP